MCAACLMFKEISLGLLQKNPPGLVSCCHSLFTACSSSSCAPVLWRVLMVPAYLSHSHGTAQPQTTLCSCKNQTDAKVSFSNTRDPDAGLLLTLASTGEAKGLACPVPCAAHYPRSPLLFNHRQVIYGSPVFIPLPGTRMHIHPPPGCCDYGCV